MVEVTRTTLTPSFVTCNKLDVLTARRSKITLNSYEKVGSMTCLMKRHKELVQPRLDPCGVVVLCVGHSFEIWPWMLPKPDSDKMRATPRRRAATPPFFSRIIIVHLLRSALRLSEKYCQPGMSREPVAQPASRCSSHVPCPNQTEK